MVDIIPVSLISKILLLNQAAYGFTNFYPFLSKVTDLKVKFVDGRYKITGNGQQNTEWAQLTKYDIYRRGAICFVFSFMSLSPRLQVLYMPW